MPNFRLLNNAIRQFHPEATMVTAQNFKEFLKEQLAKVDFSYVRKDVERFLVNKEEVTILDKGLIMKLIK